MTAHEHPAYTLECRAPDGGSVHLLYRPHTSELTDTNGLPFLADVRDSAYDEIHAVSPTSPGRKSGEVETLKIQLGLRCNYACSYCNQASFVPGGTVTSTAEVAEFLSRLPAWLQGAPSRIEFWGGEPLVYFAKLRRLVPALRARYPGAEMSIVTNGSLFDEEILDFVEKWDLFVIVSHDGPGQHLRGPDPFGDPKRAHWLRELWRRQGGARRRVLFNVVFTPANADIRATRAWLAQRVGDEEVAVTTEGAVLAYDDSSLQGAARWSQRDYQVLHDSIVAGFLDGEALRYESIRAKARDFVAALQGRRPSAAVGQKCGMDQPGELAVDLKGNVMTCQNTGAQGKHHLGNVMRMEDVRLHTATHWSHRESCRHCPLVQLCKGGCMFLHGEHFAQSCENEYRYNLAILAGVLLHATGLKLEGITGDIRRPRIRSMIPIRAVGAAA